MKREVEVVLEVSSFLRNISSSTNRFVLRNSEEYFSSAVQAAEMPVGTAIKNTERHNAGTSGWLRMEG